MESMESVECRLCCISSGIMDMKNIFDEQNIRLLEKLNCCACFTFSIAMDDGFSPYLCNECIKLLEIAYDFKLKCEAANVKFWKMRQTLVKSELEVDSNCYADDHRDIYSSHPKHLEAHGDSLASSDAYIKSEISHREYLSSASTYKNEDVMDNEPVMLYCDVCGLNSNNKTNLIIHMKNHQKSKATSKPSNEEGVKKRRNRIRNAKCEICNETFGRQRDLLRHVKNIHNLETAKICQNQGRGAWICDVCGKAYKSKHSLEFHKKGTHVQVVEKKYSCDLCNYKCREARNLIEHNRTHSGEKPHQCTECGASFTTHGSLSRHISRVHKKERPFQCNICGKGFASNLRCRQHANVHSGEMPYQCPQCPKTYRYDCGLKKHMKKRHPGVKTPCEETFRR